MEFLLNHASRGDLAAREILELVLRANEHPKEHPKLGLGVPFEANGGEPPLS